MKAVSLLGVKISLIESCEINSRILEFCSNNQKAIIANSNINALNIASEQRKMKDFLNYAQINFIDGDGVNWGLKLTGQKTGPKVTYDWWIWELAEFSSQHKLSWYLLGASQNSIEKAVLNLNAKFPELLIKGYCNGYFDEKGLPNQTVIDEINKVKPNILIMAMGMPKQEYWLTDNWDELIVNVALTGGAVLDYVAGELISTPNIIRKLQLEWFFRFIHEPKRLFKRYFIGNPLFFYRIFLQKFGLKNFN